MYRPNRHSILLLTTLFLFPYVFYSLFTAQSNTGRNFFLVGQQQQQNGDGFFLLGSNNNGGGGGGRLFRKEKRFQQYNENNNDDDENENNNNNNKTVRTMDDVLATTINQPPISTTPRKPKLADGCHSVYLDLGSNIGVQVRKLFEPEKYPNCESIAYFERVLGPIEDRRLPGAICVFGFEPNPIHLPRLREIETCYNNKKGWKVKFFPLAVSNTNDDHLKFYLDHAKQHQHWMATLFPGGQYHDPDQKPIIVNSIDIGEFVMSEIIGRDLGTEYKGKWKPTIYAKFDIEGGEYSALASLLFKGALCHMTISSIEWHRELMERNMGLEKAKPFQEFRELLVNLLDKHQAKWDSKFIGCKPMILERWDDEDYHLDNMPLPEECGSTT
jgi:hypothetical protein